MIELRRRVTTIEGEIGGVCMGQQNVSCGRVIVCACLLVASGWTVGCGKLRTAADNTSPGKTALSAGRTVQAPAKGWERFDIAPRKFSGGLQEVAFVDAYSGWAIGWDGMILHTSDGGRSWSKQNGNTERDLRDVWFASKYEGWIIGGGGVNTDLLHTTDSGETWRKETQPVTGLARKLDFIDGNNGWLAGLDPHGSGRVAIAHTADGGTSWALSAMPEGVSDPDDWTVFATSFVSQAEGWTIGHRTIRHTRDGGATWDLQYVRPHDAMPFCDLEFIQFLDSRTGWVVGRMNGDMGNATTILRTIDGGVTWREAQPPIMFNGFRFLSASVGVGVGYSFNDLTGESRRPKGNDTDGVMVLTTNGGETWEEIYRIPGGNLYDVVFTENGHGWAIGAGGILLHYTPRKIEV